MISQKIQKALQGSSAIRAMFVEGNELPGYNLYQLPIHTPDNIGAMPKFDFVNSDKYKINAK